jgi:transcriptional regulator with AAA-type ATPase domain
MENHTLGEEMSNENWISEFDEKFMDYDRWGNTKELKEYVQNKIKQAEERVKWNKEIDLAKTIDFYVAKERERIVKEIIKLNPIETMTSYDVGYNDASQDIINLINLQ